MSMRSRALCLLCPLLMAILLPGLSMAQESEAEPQAEPQAEAQIESQAKPQTEQVLGTWLKTGVNIDGQRVTDRLVIESADSEGKFHFRYQQVTQGADEIALGEGDGVISAGGRKYVVMDVERTRVLKPEEEATDWNTSQFSIVAQIIGDRMHSTAGMDSKGGVWNRENTTTPIITADKLKMLAPLLGTYIGEHEDPGSKGYGVAAGTNRIVTTHRLSPSGKLVIGEWTSTPKGGTAKGGTPKGGTADDAFEVRAVCSYSPTEKAIIVDYHSSTGVSMRGKIVAVDKGKMLWERKGDSPAGAIHEYCLFDFSEPGKFAHTIVNRTVDGIHVPSEEGITITLNKQE